MFFLTNGEIYSILLQVSRKKLDRLCGVFHLKDLGISALLDDYGILLGEKQRELLELYYNEDFSLSEIAELKSMSRQGVSDSIRRARGELEGFEKKLGLSAKRRQTEGIIKQLRAVSKKIEGPYGQELAAAVEELEKVW